MTTEPSYIRWTCSVFDHKRSSESSKEISCTKLTKMFSIVFVSLFLASSVLGAEDPTKICLPDEFESTVFSFRNNEAGRLIIDYTDEVVALSFPRTGRFVYNLTDGSGFRINDTENTCVRLPGSNTIREADVQCLPASAVLLTNNSRIGLPQDGLDTEAWEVETPNFITRVVLIRGPPAIPVLREIEVGGVNDVLFFINPSLTVSDSSLLTVPQVCSQATVVG